MLPARSAPATPPNATLDIVPRERGVLSFCVVSDTHGFEQGLGAAPEADVLVHCGDFDGLGALDHWLSQQPHRAIVVVRGNHDRPGDAALDRLPRSGALYASRRPAVVAVAGARMLLVPYARGVPVLPASASSCDVVFSHLPPRGILDKTQRGHHVGCPTLRARVGAWACPPSAWAFGHIHEAHGSRAVSLRAKSADPDYPETLCLNAANANDGKARRLQRNRPPAILRLRLPSQVGDAASLDRARP